MDPPPCTAQRALIYEARPQQFNGISDPLSFGSPIQRQRGVPPKGTQRAVQDSVLAPQQPFEAFANEARPVLQAVPLSYKDESGLVAHAAHFEFMLCYVSVGHSCCMLCECVGGANRVMSCCQNVAVEAHVRVWHMCYCV